VAKPSHYLHQLNHSAQLCPQPAAQRLKDHPQSQMWADQTLQYHAMGQLEVPDQLGTMLIRTGLQLLTGARVNHFIVFCDLMAVMDISPSPTGRGLQLEVC
jgi:hypothetical protein